MKPIKGKAAIRPVQGPRFLGIVRRLGMGGGNEKANYDGVDFPADKNVVYVTMSLMCAEFVLPVVSIPTSPATNF